MFRIIMHILIAVLPAGKQFQIQAVLRGTDRYFRVYPVAQLTEWDRR